MNTPHPTPMPVPFTFPTVDPRNIPEVMRNARAWILWRPKQKPDGTVSKIPINPATKRTHKGTVVPLADRRTLDEILIDADERFGIGFVMESTGFACVDFDHCNPDDANDWRTGYVKRVLGKTYVERSVSGTGIHIFCIGTVPDGRCRGKFEGREVEQYSGPTFIAITGDVLMPCDELGSGTGLLQELADRIEQGREQSSTQKGSNCFVAGSGNVADEFDDLTHTDAPTGGHMSTVAPDAADGGTVAELAPLTDDELIAHIKDDPTGRELFVAGVKQHDGITADWSTIDFRLFCALAQYTHDSEQIERVARLAAIARTEANMHACVEGLPEDKRYKWDARPTYLRDSIGKAIETAGTTYTVGEGGSMPGTAGKAAKQSKNGVPCVMANYANRFFVDESGKTKVCKDPVDQQTLVDKLFAKAPGRFGRIDDCLFFYRPKRKEITWVTKPATLFSCIYEALGGSVDWSRGDSCVTKSEYFEAVRTQAQKYLAVSYVHHDQQDPDIFYVLEDLPKADPAGASLDRFLDMFYPETPIDRSLMMAELLSFFWYRRESPRPISVVTAPMGQRTGKSTFIAMVAAVVGDGCMISKSAEDLNDSRIDRLKRELLSVKGLKAVSWRFDNVTGHFNSDTLADWSQSQGIDGMAPYGASSATRLNDIKFSITSNGATFGKDIIDRSVFIKLANPPQAARAGAEQRILAYIKANRLQMIADCLHRLRTNKPFENELVYLRCNTWAHAVLMPCCSDVVHFRALQTIVQERQRDANGEQAEIDAIQEVFIEKLRGLGLNPDTDMVYIHNQLVREWCMDAIPGYGGSQGRNAIQKLAHCLVGDAFPELKDQPKRWPATNSDSVRKLGTRISGHMWNYATFDHYSRTSAPYTVYAIDRANTVHAVPVNAPGDSTTVAGDEL